MLCSNVLCVVTPDIGHRLHRLLLALHRFFIFLSHSLLYFRSRLQTMSGTVSKPSKDSFVNAPRVLITGGANGLGSHIAHAFLKEGYRVAVLDINRPALDKFKTLLSTHTKGQPLVDVDNQVRLFFTLRLSIAN